MNQRISELVRDFEKPTGASAAAIKQFREEVPGSVPEDYLNFVAKTNGAFGEVTGTEALVKLLPIEEVVGESKEYEITQRQRGALLIGTDGAGRGYILLTHKKKPEFIYSDLIGFDDKSQWMRMGDCFEVFLENLVELQQAWNEDREPQLKKSLKSRPPRKKKAAKIGADEPGEVGKLKLSGQILHAEQLCYSADGQCLRFAKQFVETMNVKSGELMPQQCVPMQTTDKWGDKRPCPLSPKLLGHGERASFEHQRHRRDASSGRMIGEGAEWRLFDVTSGQEVWRRTFDAPEMISSPKFSPDGNKVLYSSLDTSDAAGRHIVHLIDIENGRELPVPPIDGADQFRIDSAYWSDDGRLVACTGNLEDFDRERSIMTKKATGVVIILDTDRGEWFQLHRSRGFPGQIAFSSVNRRVVVSDRGELILFDLESRSELLRHPGQSLSAWLPGDRHLLCYSAKSGIDVVDAQSGEIVHRYEGRNAKVQWLAVSPDGLHFATYTPSGKNPPIRIWRLPQVS